MTARLAGRYCQGVGKLVKRLPRLPLPLRFLVGMLACAAGQATCESGEAFDGAALFADQCADCHGSAGQGTELRRQALAGDLPVKELARVIAETMPEGDPESCVGAEAEAIARHAHKAFYSPLAQARIRPPRRELSRLTVRQYEQTLADLFAEFRGRQEPEGAHGLSARFMKRVNAAGIGDPVRLVLPRAAFQLSQIEELPESFRDPEVEGPERFGNSRIDVVVTISGGLTAPETGNYEFLVETDSGVELDINETAVIDAKIRSDSEKQVRGSIRLVGGRTYPLKLQTSRTKQEDLQLALRWRPPAGIEEVVPERVLSAARFSRVHATSVRFPADDRSVGYVRGASVSAAWDEATTAAALEAVEFVLADLPAFLGVSEDDTIERKKARAFCERFASTAFRRPLNESERRVLIDRFFVGDDLDEESRLIEAIEFSLLSVLKSPRFLYPEAAALDAGEGYSVANRLALGLWDSLPDRPLRKQAAKGALSEVRAVRRQAERMLKDQRTRSKLTEFFGFWLRLDHASQPSRDPDEFPDFNDRIAADMRASLERLLDEIVWHDDADLRELFLTEDLFVNARLAEFLGLSIPEGDPESFHKASVDTRERAGVVSHPFIVTAFSYYRETSPIHRGVFLARNVLGRSLRPPPEAVAPLAPELAPDMTTRERVAAQTSPGACQACHVLINDLGFTLERFDAVGRYRETELDRPIDARGGYIATDGGTVRLGGARDLARFLADSEDVHRSFVTQLFEHVTKQPILAYGVETRERLLADFRANHFNIRDLLCDIAVTAALAD